MQIVRGSLCSFVGKMRRKQMFFGMRCRRTERQRWPPGDSPVRPHHYLLSSLWSCSLPLTVSDFSWPSSSTSTRSCPFSTILQQRRDPCQRQPPQRQPLRCKYRFVVIFRPLMNLVEVDTDLKLPAPPPPPRATPPLLKDEEKEAIPPPMSGKELKPAEEQRSEEGVAPLGAEVPPTVYVP